MVEAVVNQIIGKSKTIINSNINTSINPVQELVLQSDLFRYLSALRYLFNGQMLKRYPRAMSAFDEFKSVYLKLVVEENLADGISKRLYRPDLDVKGTAAIYITVANLYLFNISKGHSSIFEAHQLFIYSIITPEGKLLFEQHQ